MAGMWNQYSKATRRELRRLAAHVVHSELEGHLATLDAAFLAWREHRLSAEELQARIHDFDMGPGRDWSFDAAENQPVAILVRGLSNGLIQVDHVPDEARPGLQRATHAWEKMTPFAAGGVRPPHPSMNSNPLKS